MDIYLKLTSKVNIYNKKKVILKDVAEIFTDKDLKNEVDEIEIIVFDDDPKKHYLISIIDIVLKIKKKFPDCSIHNLGITDVVIECDIEKKKDSKFMQRLKIAFISVVLFAGSSTAIMSFHSDSQIPQVFKNFNEIFFGKSVDNPAIITIPYSIGLAVGIIMFFNHFFGKKVTDDPTPIEVEMSSYDATSTDAMVSMLNIEKQNHKEGKTSNDFYD